MPGQQEGGNTWWRRNENDRCSSFLNPLNERLLVCQIVWESHQLLRVDSIIGPSQHNNDVRLEGQDIAIKSLEKIAR